MLVWSCVFSWLSSMFALIYYARYSINGRSYIALLVTSRVLFALADLIAIVLMICLAKGWTIVRSKLPVMGRVKIAIYTCSYFSVTLASIITYYTLANPWTIRWFYETPSGIVLACQRAVAVMWFYYAVRITQDHFKMKKRFYRKFLVIGLAWLGVGPFGGAPA